MGGTKRQRQKQPQRNINRREEEKVLLNIQQVCDKHGDSRKQRDSEMGTRRGEKKKLLSLSQLLQHLTRHL